MAHTGCRKRGRLPTRHGSDIDHGAKTVQLMPYLDTPNNGESTRLGHAPAELSRRLRSVCVANGLASSIAVTREETTWLRPGLLEDRQFQGKE